MSATARKPEPLDPGDSDGAASSVAEPAAPSPTGAEFAHATEYATRGARGHRAARPHLRIVSPLRPERAGRGLFALVVGAVLVVGMVIILVINTTLAQGAFTVSELQERQAELAQQEQALSEAVAAAAAPRALEQQARAMGMVPTSNPVFVEVPSGRVLGKPKPAGGVRSSLPRLLTPADATVTEAVDNGAADLPVSVPVGYDPAAADLAANQEDRDAGTATDGRRGTAVAKDKQDKTGAQAKPRGQGKRGEAALWEDSTVIDVTGTIGRSDADLTAVPID